MAALLSHVVWDIPAMGNKFTQANKTGPQGAAPLVSGSWRGTIFLKVEP